MKARDIIRQKREDKLEQQVQAIAAAVQQAIAALEDRNTQDEHSTAQQEVAGEEDESDTPVAESSSMAQKRSLMKKQSAATKREKQDGRRDAQQQRILGPQAKRVQKTSKKTRLLDILGANVTCARVGRLNRVLRVNLPDDQASRLVAVIRDVCLYATRMRFLQMAFTKYFILVCHDAHLPLHPYIFDPHFYHAVQQLFLGKAITNAAVIAHHSTTILRAFMQFRQQYPALQISRLGGIHGTREYATTLNHLNKQTATGHINFIVETFHTRLMHCLAAQLHGHLSNLKHGHALAYARHLIVEQCKLAEEHPAPNVDYINEERVQHAVEQVRQGLRIDLETIWSVYALEKTEGEHEAWDAWANAHNLGEDATLAILQDIAQEERETIPPVGRVDMAFITRKPHLFLHYLLMVDEYAEEHNDFIQRQSTKMLFEADRPFALQQVNQLRLQLTRPQRRRLARAIVSAINAEPPYHPPHDDHLHDDDDDTDEAHGAAIARRQAFDPQPWRHLGTNALHKLSTVVAQARKRLYWSNKVRQWGNTSDRSMLARCLYGKASFATRQLRVFGPSPTPSFVRIHITLDDESLSTLLTSAGIPIRPKQGCFNRVFAPAALVSAHALSSNPPRMATRSVCHTDGHRISLLYAKSKAPLPQLPLLDLSDFRPWELGYFQIWGLDPGQRDLIVAADGAQPSMYEYPLMAQDNMLNGRYFAPVMHVPRDAPVPSVKSPHQVRQLSSMEYRVAQHQQQTKMETWKRKSGIKLVESQMPSPRTTQLDKLHDYLVYINTHLDDLLRHYSLKYNKARFEIRRATQKMDAEAVNILIHGGKKYQTQDPRTITSEENLSSTAKWRPSTQRARDRRPSLVFYGDAALDSQVFQGRRTQAGLPGRIKRLYQGANAQGRLVMINISEFLTSQVCSACGARSLSHLTPVDAERSLYSVLMCSTCRTKWNRDVNAARNILAKGLFMIVHERYQGNFDTATFQRGPNETRPRPGQ